MEDIEELNNLLNFYRQRSSELEFSNLKLQLQVGKLQKELSSIQDKVQNNNKKIK